MNKDDGRPLWAWSAGDLAEAVRHRHVGVREVVTAHLERRDAVNDAVNALVESLDESALEAADRMDEALAAGGEAGPLCGVPVSVKANVDLAGSATSFGVPAFAENRPTEDVAVTALLKQAGAIPVGRGNLPEFGLRWHTDNPLHGPTRNPWNPDLTPGGSSGGDAAAVAVGMTPLGLGNDMGGSIRVPAQFCGIAGLRPSFGRVSSRLLTTPFGHSGLYEQIAAVSGPLARHVEDLRLALRVLQGEDPEDPNWRGASAEDDRTGPPCRVAVLEPDADVPVHPSIAAAIRQAADTLAEAGYRPESVCPPSLARSTAVIERIVNVDLKIGTAEAEQILSADAWNYLGVLLKDTSGELRPYHEAIGERYEIAADWSRFMQDFPLILGPVTTQPPFAAGADLAGAARVREIIDSLRLTELCNLLGLPAVCVPVGLERGLPQAVQLVGRRFRDSQVLDAAAALEIRHGVITPIDPRTG